MSKSHELISAIYAATLIPEDFNRKFDNLDELLFGETVHNTDAGAGDLLDSTAYSHIENARSIQQRIGRARSPEQKIESILGAIPNPSHIITRRGSVIASNRLAVARQGRQPASLGDCITDEAIRRQVSQFVARSNSDKLLAIAGQGAASAEGAQVSVLVKRLDGDLLPEETGPLFLLSIVDLGFDGEAIILFRDTFGLTEAESRVAVLLASGLRLPDIASERNVTIDTVRTQIKAIKSKTSVRDIPALVRLICGFNAGALAPTAGMQAKIMPVRGIALRPRHRMTLSDGRRLEYVDQGAPDGEPVLLFHNLPYGVDLPDAAVRQAEARGLRFIAPFRPSYAGSDSVPQRGDDLLSVVASDARELLQHLGIRQAVVLSHSTSAPFALRLARLYPELVSQLIAVSRPPAWHDEWLRDTPQRQRFVLRLTRDTPQLLPVVLWAMGACVESRYAREFVAYACRDGAADSHATENPEIVDLIARGSAEALRNSIDGMAKECEITITDFTAEARSIRHKFLILHGSDDLIVLPAHSQRFAADVPGTTVRLVPGAGQLLFYSHWQHVLDAVQAGPAIRSVWLAEQAS